MNIHWFAFVMLVPLWCPIRWCKGAPQEATTKSTSNAENIKIYCGKFLADTLASLCHGDYQTLRPAKTNARINKKDFWASQMFSDMPAPQQTMEFLSQTQQETSTTLSRRGRRRRRRGVYDECCRKACRKEQLLMYCAAPPTGNASPSTRTLPKIR